MVVKKFDKYEFPVLFSDRPKDLDHPFKGVSFMPINNPEFASLEESDGYVNVNLVQEKVIKLEHYVYHGGIGKGFERNEISNREAIRVADLIKFKWERDAEITGYYPHIKIFILNPKLSKDESGNLEIKFVSTNGNLSEFIDACMTFSSMLKEQVLKYT